MCNWCVNRFVVYGDKGQLENFNKTEDEIGLPDDAEYVDGSFRLSNSNKEELIAMIKIINKVQEEKK